MSIEGVHGKYVSRQPDVAPLSNIDLRLQRLDLVAHWRRCGKTADYVADFLCYNFGHAGPAANVLSTVVNEMVENAVKFSLAGQHYLQLSTPYWGEELVVETRHLCTRDQAERLRAWVHKLSRGDPETLFLRQVEYTAAHAPSASGLGLITIVKDYGARLGLHVRPGPEDAIVEVAFQVAIDPETIDYA